MTAPKRLPLTRDELLVLLMEECAEVIKAASKCLRFGYDRRGPNDYGVNDEVLSEEIGDLTAVIDALPLKADFVHEARRTKIRRAERAKYLYGREGDNYKNIFRKDLTNFPL